MRREFIVYYADGSVLHGVTLEDWKVMPVDGVLVVVDVFDRVYKARYACTRHAGYNYYWMVTAPLAYMYRGNYFNYEAGDIKASSARYIPPSDVVVNRAADVDGLTWERIYNQALVDVPVS